MIDAIQLGSFEGHTLNTDAVRPLVTLISLGTLLLCLSRNTNLESKKVQNMHRVVFRHLMLIAMFYVMVFSN